MAAAAAQQEELAPQLPAPPAGPVTLSDEEKAAAVEQLRQLVVAELGDDAEARRFCTPETMERFTRAMNYDVPKALEFVRSTLKWRAAKRPWEVICEGCAANPRTHSLRCVGLDKARRPVLYHCFSQADARFNATHNNQHLMRILDDCCRVMDAQEPPVGQWVMVFDFHGYGLWDNNPTTVIQAAAYLPMHPNRLFKVVMLDAPTVFNATWQLAAGYLSEITKAKIGFCSLAELRGTLEPWAGAEVADWVHAEATQNRELAAAGADAAASKAYWLPPAEAGAHDPRGTASWVADAAFFLPTQWAGQREAPAGAGAGTLPARSGSWLWG